MRDEVHRMLAQLVGDFEQENRRREEQAAKADPERHKLSRVYAAGVSPDHQYYRGMSTPRRGIKFCFARNPNVAGYWLTWVEIHRYKVRKKRRIEWTGARRIDFRAWKTPGAAETWAMRQR